jgi:hypothetical protein
MSSLACVAKVGLPLTWDLLRCVWGLIDNGIDTDADAQCLADAVKGITPLVGPLLSSETSHG